MNRLIFYSFFDPKGIVDDYVIFQLKEFSKHAEEVIVVVNGFLMPVSEKKLKGIASQVLIRPNEGFDAGGYKYALEQYGYKNLKGFDELVCLNHTCFGPIFPLSALFDTMDKKQCDWWSFFRDCCPDNFVEGYHLPSYFVAYRKSLFCDKGFKEFWDTMPSINTYEDAVKLYENRQTPFFDKRGFKYETYIDTSIFDTRTDNWPLTLTAELLMTYKIPLLKRRPFFVNRYGALDGELYRQIIPFIRKKTSYPIDLIFDNLKRTQQILSLKQTKFWAYLLWRIKMVLFKSKRQKYRDKFNKTMTKQELIQLFER